MTGEELIKALEPFKDKKICIRRTYHAYYSETFYVDVKRIEIEEGHICIET